MVNFTFYAPTEIVFGRDTQKKVGVLLLKSHAKKVLFHYGGASIKKSGLYDQIAASLKASDIDFVELGGVKPNPRLSLVREGIALCRKEKVDFILAVGGGSVIDSAKAIAVGVCYDGDVWEVYEQHKPVEKALPVATVLTIPAAGSEMSGDSVVTNEEKQMKLGYGAPAIRPVFSIMNPEFFFTLPKNQIANGAADMMSHIFERYFTNTTSVELTDQLCEATLRVIMKNALLVIQDPSNYDAWCEVGFGGTVAHNGILGVGRVQDWACHGMEHELSAIYDVAHGAGLAVLTPAWMEYVYKENIPMFVQFAVNVMGVKGSYREPESIIKEGIARLREFFRKMGLPARLAELGIEEDKLELMAKKATGVAYGETESPLGGLKKLQWQDVLAIYKLAK
ncbi:MAG: iron-containing alcohol dehydrogenase [Treponema sp.]|jgi:alcohol dehydrogenase YqhD (iron-dependent ADH family)|nr:iron-containing alcohol dehydrogenase [Treponema sp.]